MSTVDDVIAERDAWLGVLAHGDENEVRAEARRRLRLCRAALDVLDARLAAIGYPVRPVVKAFPVDVDDLCGRLAASDVAVPAPLVVFWEVVGEVSVLDLARYAHVRFWEARGVGYVGEGAAEYCDGLHVDSPGEHGVDAYVDYVAEERSAWIDSGDEAEGLPFEFPLAPDGFHKDNISGGEPYALIQGAHAWDWQLANFAWSGSPVTAPSGPPDFVSYLRTAVLECACFPGFIQSTTFKRDRQYLTVDLPIF